MPLEKTGPDANGLFGLRYVPGVASATQSLQENEKSIIEVVESMRSALGQYVSGDRPALYIDRWTIDAVNGSDSAPTRSGAVLKTARELIRRWGNGILRTSVEITQVGDLAPGDGWNVNGLSAGGDFDIAVTVNVVPRSIATLGTVTGNTPINHSDPHDCAQYVAIAPGGAGIAWAPYIDGLVRRESDGACAFPDTDMGGGRCRFSPFMVPTGQDLFLPIVSPVDGDVLQLVTPGKCHNLILHYTDVVFVFNNAWFDDESGKGHDLAGLLGDRVQFNGCKIDGFMYVAQGLGPGYSGCHFTGNLYTVVSQPFVWGCHFVGGAYALEGAADVDGDTLLRSSRMFFIGPAQGNNHMNTVNNVGGYGNGVGALVAAGQGGKVYIGNSSTGQGTNVYGAMDYNADVHTNSTMIYVATSAFKVSTAIAQFLQGGVARAGVSPAAVLPLEPDAGLNAIVMAA